MDTLYTTSATATGARAGDVATDDGRLQVSLSRPGSMGGDDGPGTNPEQLFAAGYAACFHSAMRFALRPHGLTAAALQGSSVTAQVSLLRDGESDYGLAVVLTGTLPGVDPEVARQVMETTHTVCPYSRATAGNVQVELRVAGA